MEIAATATVARLRQALKFSARLRDGHLQFITRPPSYLLLDHLMQWAAKKYRGIK
jgi:hypothetical protein